MLKQDIIFKKIKKIKSQASHHMNNELIKKLLYY